MTYINVSVEVDPASIQAESIEVLEARVPGLTVEDGHLLNFLLEADSIQHAENRELLTEITELIFEHYGTKVLRIQFSAATQATGLVTITATDTLGHVIDAGTEITLLRGDGEREAFTTRVVAEIPAASDEVTDVEIIAVDPGEQATGLQSDAQFESQAAWLDTITVQAPTTGGEDAETEEAYRDRLAEKAALMADTLVLPVDYEADARVNVTGVFRALAIDLYDADTSTEGSAGHITVAVVDENGLDPGGTIRTDGETHQQDLSVSGLLVHWIPATYTSIDVVFAAVCYSDFDPATVEANVIAALEELLSPANHGLPPFGDEPLWLDRPVIRLNDVIHAIENVDGVDYTTAPTGTATTSNGSPNLTLVTPTTGWVNGMVISGTGIPAGTTISSGAGTATMVMSANASASAAGVAITGAKVTVDGTTADVALTGPAAMPLAGTIAGSVELP